MAASSDSANFAVAETLLYGGKLDDHPLTGGLNAISQGVTSSHIATRITFTDKNMYQKHIQGTKIPCEIYTKTLQDGKEITVYEVYASYGPARSSLVNPGATLDPRYYVNTINSGLLTEASENSNAAAWGLDRTVAVQSPIPFIGALTRKDIHLNVQSIIRYTPETKEAVQKFQNNLLASDAQYRKNPTPENLDKHLENLEQQFKELRNSVKPGMPMSQFMHEFNEKMGTVGLPERVLSTTKLVDDASKGHSLDLMLGQVRKVYDNLSIDQYNLITHNCAHFIKNLFVNSTTNAELKAVFFNDPIPGVVTPVSVMEGLDKENVGPLSSISSDSSITKIRPVAATSPASPTHRPSLFFSYKFRGLNAEPFKDFAYAADNNFAVKAINTDQNKTLYIFYDKNIEIARGFHDKSKDTESISFELPLPLDKLESGKLLKGIKENIPEAKKANLSFNINASVDQMAAAEELKALLNLEFKGAQIRINETKPKLKLGK